ncbi:MAG: hypothetical protein P0Y53_10420 [Candidatus Pseudobacter hemicellulosilyticus]|uniref:Uncharacterized protein n=1 Tax=Candidatus Pseudobacter hemicellulosilyticus TaxID=3121375 RepID=A0AAJ5WWL5_9BACT|nr:MAG: hypothetical protein P0Y53_10420 [Pseudobacter sp.]
MLPTDVPSLWINVFTGGRFTTSGQLSLQQLFAQFPVALLSSEPE